LVTAAMRGAVESIGDAGNQHADTRSIGPKTMAVAVFSTELGWFALVGSDGVVDRLLIGHRSARQVRAACAASPFSAEEESDWRPQLRLRLQQYAEGEPDDFHDVIVRDTATTPFQRKVLRAVRGVRFGETVTYGELAALSGSPSAARAVGAVMARNRVPIVFPCHRVVAAGGRLGGFSAPDGLNLKQRMLQLEGAIPSLRGRN
jgi:methylated-DNA-[protein]-cysteine S-methyltransferase